MDPGAPSQVSGQGSRGLRGAAAVGPGPPGIGERRLLIQGPWVGHWWLWIQGPPGRQWAVADPGAPRGGQPGIQGSLGVAATGPGALGVG